MYRMIKALNNNVAIVKNMEGQQSIIMGRGIAYQKRKGDLIKKDGVEKVFRLEDRESQQSFSQLMKDIPMIYIETAHEIIEKSEADYQYPVQEYIYITLPDHIYWSAKAIQAGTYQPAELPDLVSTYPVEHEIALKALAFIEEKLEIKFPQEEILRIALHFINAKKQSMNSQQSQVTQKEAAIQLFKQILRENGITRTTENQNFYDRLIIHVSYFVDRIDKSEDAGEEAFSKKMEAHLIQDYQEEYQVANRIFSKFEQALNREFSVTERVYFAIHIQRLL